MIPLLLSAGWLQRTRNLSTKQVPLWRYPNPWQLIPLENETGLGEVIIVITPSVLPGDAVHAGMPRMKMPLTGLGIGFRDAEFVLRYLWLALFDRKSNLQLQKVADRIVQDYANYRRIYPYNKFSFGSVQEDALVRRQIMKFSALMLLMFLTPKNWFFSNQIVRLDQV